MKPVLIISAVATLLCAGPALADSLESRMAGTQVTVLSDQDMQSVHARAVLDDLVGLLNGFDQGSVDPQDVLDAVTANSLDPFNGDMSFLGTDTGAEDLFLEIINGALGMGSNPFGADWMPLFNCRAMALPSCDEANQAALEDLLP